MYSCTPKGNPNYTFRESIPLGVTSISTPQVARLSSLACPISLRPLSHPAAFSRAQFRRSIEGLQDEWQGWTYDLLSRNCNHFCEALVEILGVGPLPGARPLVRACTVTHARAHARMAERPPARFRLLFLPSPCAAAWVNRFAVNADYALETSQTALTEVKKIWKSSADTLTLATGWLKDHLTIGARRSAAFQHNTLPPHLTCSRTAAVLRRAADPALLAVPPPFGPQQQQPPGAQAAAAAPAAAAPAAAAAAPAAAPAASAPAAAAAATAASAAAA